MIGQKAAIGSDLVYSPAQKLVLFVLWNGWRFVVNHMNKLESKLNDGGKKNDNFKLSLFCIMKTWYSDRNVSTF